MFQTIGFSTIVTEWEYSWIFVYLGTNLEVLTVILFWAQICSGFSLTLESVVKGRLTARMYALVPVLFLPLCLLQGWGLASQEQAQGRIFSFTRSSAPARCRHLKDRQRNKNYHVLLLTALIWSECHNTSHTCERTEKLSDCSDMETENKITVWSAAATAAHKNRLWHFTFYSQVTELIQCSI